MNTLEYEIENLKEYELKIWTESDCKSLAKIKRVGNNIVWDYSGCTNISDYVKVGSRDGVTEGLIKQIRVIRKIVEGIVLAGDYLISENSISLKLDKVWIDSEKEIVKLLPGCEEGELIDRICELLISIGGKDLSEKIKGRDSQSKFSYHELLRFLSSYELELR